MVKLQEQMDAWLVGTGLNIEPYTAFVSDLLVVDGTLKFQVSFFVTMAGS
jgi:hypothetical protein